MPILLLAFFVALATLAGAERPLVLRIEQAASESPIAQRGHWGVHVVNLTTGELVYARNEHNYFIPASNTKLFSTALALSRLGPDHRFVTRLTAAAAPSALGILEGDLRLVGGGDPTLSGRPLPYDAKAPFGPPLQALDSLAEQAWNAGLRRVEGSVVGDDTAYLWDPFPSGWAQDDTRFPYGAPVSALTLHDNSFTVTAMGGSRPGDPAQVTVSPSPSYWSISSRLQTNAGDAVRIRPTLDREPGSRTLALWGALAPGQSRTFSIAVDDPAHYAAFAMREALERRGISVLGSVRAEHRHLSSAARVAPPGEVELARRVSGPLVETLRVINKVSQNLHAEIVLRETARMRGAEPGLSGGLQELKSFLTEAGIPETDYQFEDGSGLSRLTLVTPAAVTRLLRHMSASPHKEAWRSLLPIGGLDGSLDERFRKLAQGRVIAKTGTLSHTGALGGYLETARGEQLAFSVMVNNANASGTAIREFLDRVVTEIVECCHQ